MRNDNKRRLFTFSWPVAEGGYEWRDTRTLEPPHIKGQFLVHKRQRDKSRTYNPLQQASALFLNFVDLPVDGSRGDAILTFASQYGQLGVETYLRPPAPGPVPTGEPSSAWSSAQRELTAAVNLWRSDRDPDALERAVNKGLRKKVSPQMLWDMAAKQLKLHLVPENLLGAMWLQLATAIDGDLDYRQCTTCGKWFGVSVLERGQARDYCSNACRSKAYRLRMKKPQRKQKRVKR